MSASMSTLLIISPVICVCYCLNFCCLQAVKKILNFLWQKMLLSSLLFSLIQVIARLYCKYYLRVDQACLFLNYLKAYCYLILINSIEAALHNLFRNFFFEPTLNTARICFFLVRNRSQAINCLECACLSVLSSQTCLALVILAQLRAYLEDCFQLLNHLWDTFCELKQMAALFLIPIYLAILSFCFNLTNYFCIFITLSASQHSTNYSLLFSTCTFYQHLSYSCCLAQNRLTFTYFWGCHRLSQACYAFSMDVSAFNSCLMSDWQCFLSCMMDINS